MVIAKVGGEIFFFFFQKEKIVVYEIGNKGVKTLSKEKEK